MDNKTIKVTIGHESELDRQFLDDWGYLAMSIVKAYLPGKNASFLWMRVALHIESGQVVGQIAYTDGITTYPPSQKDINTIFPVLKQKLQEASILPPTRLCYHLFFRPTPDYEIPT